MIVTDVRFLNMDKIYEATRFILETQRSTNSVLNYSQEEINKFFNITQVSMTINDISLVEALFLKEISTQFIVTDINIRSCVYNTSIQKVSDDALRLSNISNEIISAMYKILDTGENKELYLDTFNLGKSKYIAGLPSSLTALSCDVSFSGVDLHRLLAHPDDDYFIITVFTNFFRKVLKKDVLDPISTFTDMDMEELYDKAANQITASMMKWLYDNILIRYSKSPDRLGEALVAADCVRELPDKTPALISYVKTPFGAIDFIEDPNEVIVENLSNIRDLIGKCNIDYEMEYTFSMRTSFLTYVLLTTALPRGSSLILDKIKFLNADIYQGSESLFPGFKEFSRFVRMLETSDYNQDITFRKLYDKINEYPVRLTERYNNFYDGMKALGEKKDIKDAMMINVTIPNQAYVHYMLTIKPSELNTLYQGILYTDYINTVALIKKQIAKIK